MPELARQLPAPRSENGSFLCRDRDEENENIKRLCVTSIGFISNRFGGLSTFLVQEWKMEERNEHTCWFSIHCYFFDGVSGSQSFCDSEEVVIAKRSINSLAIGGVLLSNEERGSSCLWIWRILVWITAMLVLPCIVTFFIKKYCTGSSPICSIVDSWARMFFPGWRMNFNSQCFFYPFTNFNRSYILDNRKFL